MHDYARICVNTPRSAWMAFAILCLLECVITYFNEVNSLKEHEIVFLMRQNLI